MKKRDVIVAVVSIVIILAVQFGYNSARKAIILRNIREIKKSYAQFLDVIRENPILFDDYNKIEFYEYLGYLRLAEGGNFKKVGSLNFIENLTESKISKMQNDYYRRKEIFQELSGGQERVLLLPEAYRSELLRAVENDEAWENGLSYAYFSDDRRDYHFLYFQIRDYLLEDGRLIPCSYEEAFAKKYDVEHFQKLN